MAQVHEQIPGIDCRLGGPPAGGNSSTKHESSEVVESKLLTVFPGVHCTGKLDTGALSKIIKARVTDVQPRENRVKRQRKALDEAVDREEKNVEAQVDTQKRSFLASCADAPHPGNCYTCVAAAAAQALGNGSKCVVAAHLALKALNANAGQIWVTYAACMAGIAGDMGASAAGCPLRVSDNFSASDSPQKTNHCVI